MSSKFLLVGAATAPPIISTGLVQHIDFGNSSSYNDTNNQSSYNSNRFVVNDLSGNSNTFQAGMGSIYGVNYLSNGNSSGWATVEASTGSLVMGPTGTLSGDYFMLYNNTSPMTGLGTGDYTWEFWVNYYRINGRDQYIDLATDNSDYDYGWAFQFHQGYLRYTTKTNSGWSNVTETTQIAPSYGYNGWKHLVISKIGTGGSNCKIYHNTVNTTTFTYNGYNNQATYSKNSWGEPGSTSTSGSVWQGMSMFRDGANRQFNGKIAVVRRYKGKGLTATEVQNNYDADKARFGL